MPSSELTTQSMIDLLNRARNGATEAQNELIQRSQARLESLARKMLSGYPTVRRWEDTLDVLQQALIRLIRALADVTPNTTREYYGLAAEQLRRVLIDLARHYQGAHGLGRNYRSGALQAQNENGAPFDPPAADADAGNLDRWAAFHEAVEQLPIEERETFSLTFYHGWTQAQIAELFSVDERTIRRRWRSACEKLHASLEGELPEAL